MPKRRQKRIVRRKRREIQWRPVLWMAVALNSLLGICFSPITAAAKVRVVGCPESEKARIVQSLQALSGVPAAFSNRAQVEAEALSGDAVETANFKQNLFGRGLLTIQPKRPVAQVFAKTPMALSSTGSVYGLAESIKLPLLVLPGDALTPSLTLGGAWDCQRIAMICSRLDKDFPQIDWTVKIDPRGIVSLYSSATNKVVLGSTDRFNEKLDQLAKALQAQPDLLARVRELNLTVPESPAIITEPSQ